MTDARIHMEDMNQPLHEQTVAPAKVWPTARRHRTLWQSRSRPHSAQWQRRGRGLEHDRHAWRRHMRNNEATDER